jgi:methionyl aminopeptidase
MSRIPRLNEKDAQRARDAAARVSDTHFALAEFLRAGVTLAEVDAEAARVLASLDCKSCFLGYRAGGLPPFPSHACLSVNECIVHGTAAMSKEPLKPGDVISIDIGVTHKGWIGDAAWTYAIEHVPDEQTGRLMEAGKESLRRGIDAIGPGRQFLDWATAVQTVVEEEHGFHCVRGLGGHGYGRKLHEPPFISNVVPTYPGEWPEAFGRWEPGILVALEPMLAVGTGRTKQDRKRWPIFSADGSMSVHYEADVLVTEDGRENLTAKMWDLPDIVGTA